MIFYQSSAIDYNQEEVPIRGRFHKEFIIYKLNSFVNSTSESNAYLPIADNYADRIFWEMLLTASLWSVNCFYAPPVCEQMEWDLHFLAFIGSCHNDAIFIKLFHIRQNIAKREPWKLQFLAGYVQSDEK